MSTTAIALKRQWVRVALIGGATLLGVGLLQPRWLLGSLVVWAYCVLVVYQGLGDNRRDESATLLPSLGGATLVTIARGALLAVTAGFLFLPPPVGTMAFVPAAAYSAAALLDHVDGRLARALGRTTRLGEKLDMELDAAGILIASLLAIHYGKIPSWYLVVGLVRYAFLAGIAWRRYRGQRVVSLDPLPTRRVLAGVQMGFLSVCLWPPIPSELTLFLAPVFGGATLAMFARDWWKVSGRLAPGS